MARNCVHILRINDDPLALIYEADTQFCRVSVCLETEGSSVVNFVMQGFIHYTSWKELPACGDFSTHTNPNVFVLPGHEFDVQFV